MARIPGIRPEIRNVHLKGVGMFQNTTVKSVLILAVGAVWLFRGVRAETEKKTCVASPTAKAENIAQQQQQQQQNIGHRQRAFCCMCRACVLFAVGAVAGVVLFLLVRHRGFAL